MKRQFQIAGAAILSVLVMTAPAQSVTLDTGDGLQITFSDDQGAITAVTFGGTAVPLIPGSPGGLTLLVGSRLEPAAVLSLDFNTNIATWTTAWNANWDGAGAYVTWLPDGGVDGTGHLLLGNGLTAGAGMAMQSHVPVVGGSNMRISWQARSASTDTTQILCVRVFDAAGSDITSTSPAPAGWGWTGTSQAHAVWGLHCTAPDTWEAFSQTYTVPANAASMRVSLRHWTGGDHLVHIDDFDIDVTGGLIWGSPIPVLGLPSPTANGFIQSVDVPGQNLHVDTVVTASNGHLSIGFVLQDTSSPQTDRPVIAYWTLPVAAAGWRWWDDITDWRTIDSGGSLSNTRTLTDHAISQYPYAAITGSSAGLLLAVPMDGPVVQRFEAASQTGLRSVWELCPSPLTGKIGAGRAAASAVLAATDPAWGFRSATAKYAAIFPQHFQKRTTREGTWLWPFHPNAVPNPEDFGFAYHETQPITNEADRAACEQYDVGIFYYSEPSNLGMSFPGATVKPSYDERVARLQSWADEEGAFAAWQASGGLADSPHLLLGDGTTTGVGMATSRPLTPPAGTAIEIAWAARTADTATLQILGVRVYDSAGNDFTSSVPAPSGWSYSSTSMAHVIPGIANTAADTWQSFAYTYAVPVSAAWIRVSVRHWTGGDHLVHVDDLRVTSSNHAMEYLSLDFTSPDGGWVTAQNDNWDAPGPMWYRVPRQQAAQAVIGSSPLDTAGRYVIDLASYLWQQDANGGSQRWPINPDPDLPSPNAYELFHDNYILPDLDRNEGVYIDSVVITSGLGNWENRRSDHLAVTDTPLTFSYADGYAAQLGPQARSELLNALDTELHARGKLIFCNLFADAMRFHAHQTDVMGSEVFDLVEADTYSRLRRTLAGSRVVTNLLQYNWNVTTYITYDQMEQYIRGQLFWGFHPGVSSGGGMWVNGGPDRYFSHPELYERDRPLFQKYIPVIKQLGSAGWEPVTRATGEPAAEIERFGDFSRGPVYLTVRGPAGGGFQGTITIDLIACGLSNESRRVAARDVLAGQPLSVERLREPARAILAVSLAVGEVGVYSLEPAPVALADFDQDGDADLADFSLFRACFNGPNRASPAGCAVDADFDNDQDVDLSDFNIFRACFNGPNRGPSAGCPTS